MEMPSSANTTSEPATRQDAADQLAAQWGTALEIAVCERCDWNYLLPQGSLPQRCPHCFQADLTAWNGQLEELPHIRPPEMALPFNVTASKIALSIQTFAQGIPFPPSDLNSKTLQQRLRRVYLPMWLVDATVQGQWQAEAGFNYQVVSHQDRYSGGGWVSQEIQQSRTRWEPRLGRLNRRYENVAAPALEEDQHLKQALGSYRFENAARYQVADLAEAYIRLPNRSPQDTWTDAQPSFQAAAAEECRQAASADHIRSFEWQSEFQDQNWTLLLLPLYATYYQDDEAHAQPVLIHGQSGKISGKRRASMKQGQNATWQLLAAAAVVGAVSVLVSLAGVLFPPILALSVLGLMIALLLGCASVYPVAAVWWFNKDQDQKNRTI